MAELTINTLIKIVLASAVLVVVILGIYFGMKSYVIPYFSGIGFETPKIDANSQFGKELIKNENKIGEIKKISSVDYFIYEGKQTEIYFTKNGEIKLLKKGAFDLDYLSPDEKIGFIDKSAKIVIQKEAKSKQGMNFMEILNNAYRNGNEVYKIK